MHRRRAVHAAGLGLIGALALAGCASDPQPAGEAWKQARTQLDEAESVRLSTAYTTGRQGPSVVTWDIAGALDGGNATSTATMGVGEDSRMVVDTRTVGEDVYARVSTEGEDVPAQVRAAYGDDGWKRLPADQAQAQANPLRTELDRIALPAADALEGADVEPEEVELQDGHAQRYAVPADVAGGAQAAAGEGEPVRVRSFTVDEDGSLVGLQVEAANALQQYELSDWNAIDPAEVPEEVSE